MNPTHTVLTRALLALALLQGALLAGEPAVWILERSGKEVGRERVEVTTLADGGQVTSSSIDVKITAAPWHAEQRLELDPQGAPRSYRLASATHQLALEPVAGGLRLSGNVAGSAVDRQLLLPPDQPAVVLDNLAWSHYDGLGRVVVQRLGLAADPAAVGSLQLTVIVPQAAQNLRGRLVLEPDAGLVARGGGGSRQARQAHLTVANLALLVAFDPADGRVFLVQVPAQGLVARREGWELLTRAQAADPAPPASDAAWRQEEVSVPGPRGAIAGALCLPRGEGPHPAALLLPGSGPQDRDETIGPNKPLRDLARALAARGIASLRCDKRTFTLNAEAQQAATPEARQRLQAEVVALGLEEEYLADGRAALVWLRARPEVDPRGLLVIGHSLGALVAPELAQAGGAAGVVLLAGPGRSLVDLMQEQLTYQATLAGAAPEEAAARARAQLLSVRKAVAGELPPEQFVLGASARYWREVDRRDLPALIRELKLPVLALSGAEDCQVRPVDLEHLRAALASRQGIPGEAHLLPGRNHLFQRVEGPSTGAEYFLPAPTDPAVAEAIATWWRQVAPAPDRPR